MNADGQYPAGTQIDCPLRCQIPDDWNLTQVPRPRHNWDDVIICPNTEDCCNAAFLVTPVKP